MSNPVRCMNFTTLLWEQGLMGDGVLYRHGDCRVMLSDGIEEMFSMTEQDRIRYLLIPQ